MQHIWKRQLIYLNYTKKVRNRNYCNDFNDLTITKICKIEQPSLKHSPQINTDIHE